jgi:hypothetical protein
MDYKNGKWAEEILNAQLKDGSWGYFHCFAMPLKNKPITTGQALRRLAVLGYTINDLPIKKAVHYMNTCLSGKNNVPDKFDKVHDSSVFNEMMLAGWIKYFTDENNLANNIAKKWGEIINYAFYNEKYDHNLYIKKYSEIFNNKPKGPRLIDFLTFYQIILLANTLDKNIEPLFFEYVINYPSGIYYFGYNKPVTTLPEVFQSKKTSDYLRMIELLTSYKNKKCREKLLFIKNWLESNKTKNNEWDLGKNSKDNILFPLSDSWKKDEDRIKDCTFMINKIIKKLY